MTLVVAISGARGAAVDADATLRALAADADGPGRIVRISVGSGVSVRLASSSAFRIVDAETGAPAWREAYRGEVAVVVDGAPSEPIPEVWRVQTGSFSTESAAAEELDRLQSRLGVPGVVRYHPDRGTYRVRVGESPDREGLAGLVARVRELGVGGAFLVAEPAREVRGVTLRIVDALWESRPTGRSRLAIVPERGSSVSVDGKPYRGIVELRAGRDAKVRAVNWVESESYLRGVVPAELGPEVWPQLEALKAQAVAARTYLYANLGQFEDDGYDLCATARCQVYGGVGIEHPLSDRAVRATRGEIVTYEGRPIDALYTATCGGHTEDVANVFPEMRAPYLRGVPCRSEEATPGGGIYVIEGARPAPVISEIGEDVTRDASLLAAMAVFETTDPGRLRAPLDGEAMRRITRKLAALAGRPAPTGPVPAVRDLVSAGRMLVEDLGWNERAEVVLEPEDVPAILRDPEALATDDRGRRALAALAAWAELRPGADGRYRIRDRVSAARLAPTLARIAEGYAADGLEEWTLRWVRGDRLGLVNGDATSELRLAARPFLFSVAGESGVSTARLDLWPGDRIAVRVRADGAVEFLELRPPLRGASDDRSAQVHSWTVRRGRREIEEAVSRRLAVGELVDLVVVRRGVSGRIVDLRVVGRGGEATVRGFDVRNLFDLRESLTSVEVQRDGDGRVTGVVFAGRGWGHGVGLCQVGAYGMALRGAEYSAILRHYYRGAVLDRAPSGAP